MKHEGKQKHAGKGTDKACAGMDDDEARESY